MTGNEKYEHLDLPIPSYEEAIASRPPISSSFRGPSEIGDDAERQGLLGQEAITQAQQRRERDGLGNYQPPIVESGRTSYDSALTSPRISEDDALRRDMEEMEVAESADAAPSGVRHRARLRLPKILTSLRNKLSLHLPSLPRIPFIDTLMQRLPAPPAHWRVGWPIIARLVGLFLIISFVYGLVVFRVFGNGPHGRGQHYLPESVRAFVQAQVDPGKIEQFLFEVSYEDHIAGTKGDFFLAERMKQYFLSARLDAVSEDNYEVYLNYPRPGGRRVAIIDPPELAFEASLEEISPTGKEQQHMSEVFHGHSKSDNVTGPLIFANYGSREDFADLAELGINVTGAVVIVKYYGTQGDRALKVKAAELAGAKGCLIYSDPLDDGAARGPTIPDGIWRPADSVQRGSVSLMSWIVGDVLTPGWASTPGADRIPIENNPGLVNIPSLPLSWRDADPLLRALQGHGAQLDDRISQSWTGNTSSPDNPIVNLQNLQDENQKQPIRNVLGRIVGIETPEKTVYIGNHRDAWCFGAVDPGSGTAVFLEVVRVFGELMQLGWRPRRSIVFASWDAEEYNLIGSTEHVEERIDQIRADGVAYLNVDSAISGHKFWADASPLFLRPLHRVLDRVALPGANRTLMADWHDRETKLGGLGAGSDYVAFQDLAGCSSIDFGFKGQDHGYPYHSCYDTFDWLKKFADPTMEFHAAIAQVWALLILEIADEPVIGFDFPFYAAEVQRYVGDLERNVAGMEDEGAKAIDLKPLRDASNVFVDNALEFDGYESSWSAMVGSPSLMESRETAIRRVSHNTRMSDFETFLLDLPEKYDLPDKGEGEGESEYREGGIPGRTQFKHVIFGPQLWSGYEEAYFPGIRDMLEQKDWLQAQEQVEIAAKRLSYAAKKLVY